MNKMKINWLEVMAKIFSAISGIGLIYIIILHIPFLGVWLLPILTFSRYTKGLNLLSTALQIAGGVKFDKSLNYRERVALTKTIKKTLNKNKLKHKQLKQIANEMQNEFIHSMQIVSLEESLHKVYLSIQKNSDISFIENDIYSFFKVFMETISKDEVLSHYYTFKKLEELSSKLDLAIDSISNQYNFAKYINDQIAIQSSKRNDIDFVSDFEYDSGKVEFFGRTEEIKCLERFLNDD